MIKLGFKVPMGTLGLHVGIEGVKNGKKKEPKKQKLAKYVPKLEILVRYSQDFS